MRIRRVTAAAAASNGYMDKAGLDLSAPGQRWSKAKTPSIRASSASWATPSAPDALAANVGRVIPTFKVSALAEAEPRRAHGADSTLAFRSRMAAWMMLPSALRLMKPGSGTRSSTASW